MGDEVALGHVISMVASAHEDGNETGALAEMVAALPDGGDAEDDFEMYADSLFEDRDFEWLWQADLDGIESDEDMRKLVGIANLHPSQWFLPFR